MFTFKDCNVKIYDKENNLVYFGVITNSNEIDFAKPGINITVTGLEETFKEQYTKANTTRLPK